ncbi:unnamed protein product [Mycena citricolor]|uniref:Uncharacterized protein n=1 Tax=Mycena citricolor TaxID=2018698 RepID=A0AAD2JXL0_9AGAR|nr:unnamed protein product [Mycena citricolor]
MTSSSPLSGTNFNPFETHPFTSYTSNTSLGHASTSQKQRHDSSTRLATHSSSPTKPVFTAAYRLEASPPELSEVLKKKRPQEWNL